MFKNNSIKVVIVVLALGLAFLAGYSYGVFKTTMDPTLRKSSLLNQNTIFLNVVEQLDRGESERARRNLLKIIQINFDSIGELDQQREEARWWYSYTVLQPSYSGLLEEIDRNIQIEEKTLRAKYDNVKNKK